MMSLKWRSYRMLKGVEKGNNPEGVSRRVMSRLDFGIDELSHQRRT
jgi:hypothetical protein